tara:strand:- start:1006 stop:1977 length:972 start_codon:yes stop_codon:yes gene_type:complete
MKKMVIDDIKDVYKVKINRDVFIIDLKVVLQDNYFENNCKEKVLRVTGYDLENNLIKTNRGGFLFSFSESATPKFRDIFYKLLKDDSYITKSEIDYETINESQKFDYPIVFFDFSRARRAETVQEKIMDMVFEDEEGENLNELMNELEYKYYPLPKGFVGNKLFFNIDNNSRKDYSQTLQSVSQKVFNYFMRKGIPEIFNRLNYIDLEKNALAVVKGKERILFEDLSEAINLKDNQFLLFENGNELESTNMDYLFELIRGSDNKIMDVFNTLSAFNNVCFLIEKVNEKFEIIGHYANTGDILIDGFYFINKENTERLYDELNA